MTIVAGAMLQHDFAAMHKLSTDEDRLAALQKEVADCKAKRNQLQSELDGMVMKTCRYQNIDLLRFLLAKANNSSSCQLTLL